MWTAVRIAGNQIRLWPMRHEYGVAQSLCVGCILQDLEMGTGVRKKVRNDCHNELAWLGSEIRLQEIGKRDDGSL